MRVFLSILVLLIFNVTLAQHKVSFYIKYKEDMDLFIVNRTLFDSTKIRLDQSNRISLPLILIPPKSDKNVFHFYQNDSLISTFEFAGNKDTVIDLSTYLKAQILDEVIVQAESDFNRNKLSNIENTYIYAGKKTETIDVAKSNVNKATNNPRQIFSKVSGINIFENDGSGLSLNIGSRGLNPNRSSNFNFKQNYYDISADALGYPESYYTPASDMIERIEVLRGASSLQFGTQFGGLVNFKLKERLSEKTYGLLARIDLGSFGFNNYTLQASVNKEKWSTYAIGQIKNGSGFRPNTHFGSQLFYFNGIYKPNEHWSIKPEITYFHYLAQQPGGLTDEQFERDPKISTRKRNWFKVNWILPALAIKYRPDNFNELNIIGSGLIAGRDALGVLTYINRADAGQERDLISDQYRNALFEARYLRKYYLVKNNLSAFLVGARYYRGTTFRSQGLADSTGLANFSFLNPEEPNASQYQFPNENLALFTENIFKISPNWSITPGLRFENISTRSKGYYILSEKDGAGNVLLYQKINENGQNKRSLLIAGIGSAFVWKKNHECYANISQNYRSINFNDIRVVNPNFKVDASLKDETGYTIDFGVRGNLKSIIQYDVSAFSIAYNNRIGNILLLDSSTFNLFRYRTNISSSINRGVDLFLDFNIGRIIAKNAKNWHLSCFLNATFTDAYYNDKDISAYYLKRVEYAPEWNIKSGFDFRIKSFRCNLSYLYVSQQFSEATNAVKSTNALSGIIPAYQVIDLNLTYKWKFLEWSASINNTLNNIYFTRRAEGYPGPGIIPADPRTFYFSLAYKFEK
jgi:Fe(3+) dicitrate transport protein